MITLGMAILFVLIGLAAVGLDYLINLRGNL